MRSRKKIDQQELHEQEQCASYLESLPLELVQHILSLCPDEEGEELGEAQQKSTKALIESCKHFYNFFQPPRLMLKFLQAVVDDDRSVVKAALDKKPELLLIDPSVYGLVIESQLTWQKFYAENPLHMAFKRRQLAMVNIMLPYYNKLKKLYKADPELSAEEKKAKIKALTTHKIEALSCWKPYKRPKGYYEVHIPEEYAKYAESLVNVFTEETFPGGKLSQKTESALLLLLNILVPKTPVCLDECIDVELFLLATIKAYLDSKDFNDQNYSHRRTFLVRVIGLIQSALSPEIARLWGYSLQSLYKNLEFVDFLFEKINTPPIPVLRKNEKPFYRSSRCAPEGLGFEHCVHDDGTLSGGMSWRKPPMHKAYRRFKSIISRKDRNLSLVTYYAKPEEELHCCVLI